MKERKTLRYRWLIFGILLAAYFLVYYQRTLPATLDTLIVDDLGEGLATLWSAAYFYAYAALQLPAGLMTDRIGPRKVLIAALMVTTVGTFATSFANSYLILMVGKIIMSCGMACIYVPLTKVIVAWFRKKDFAKLNGGVIATGNFAGIMAAYPTTILLNSIIWRDMFFIIGVITIILTFLCILFVHNRPKDIGMREIRELYPEDEQMHETYGKVPLRNGVATVLRSGRAFWMPASTYFFVFGTMMLFQGRWAAKYFDTTYEFIIAGTFLVTMLAVGKMISTAISGTVASKIGSKRITVLAANFGYLGVWGVLWIFAGKIDMLWFWVGMNFMFGFFSGFVSLSFAQVKEWFPASISGTAIALVNTMVFLGGGVLQTLSIWIINERSPAFGEFTVMWGIAFLCVAAACVLSYMSKDNNTGSVRPIRDSGGT